MRRFPVTPFVLLVAVVALVGGWLLFAQSEHSRYVAVQKVRNSESRFTLSYAIDYPSGRIAREAWSMSNDNGRSVAAYAITDRNGSVAKFDEHIAGYEVTFLFQKLVADGIWDLQSRPFRGKSDAVHTVRVTQTVGDQSGVHRFTFSDPEYLANDAGRQYEIHLDKNRPVPNLVMLQSTSSADPRYLAVVNDFEQFGTPSFRRTMIAARAKLLKASNRNG